MTGIELLEKLRSARMEFPVIMATGSLPTYEFVRKPWLTPDAVLRRRRPFTPEELLATVQKVLSKDDGYSNESSPLLRKYL
jgi:DNA-binding response OmpR family regulator